MTLTVGYRHAVPEDRQFILSGWSASLRMTRDVPFIPMDGWAGIMHPVIRKVIDRPRVRVVVAEGEILWGFLCYEKDAELRDPYGRWFSADYVYYVYVAQPFRKRGVARALFAAADIDPRSRFCYACRTLASWECREKFPNASYSPFHARFAPKENDEQRNA